jgi:D-alanyl-D-alanine carboxypeptidase
MVRGMLATGGAMLGCLGLSPAVASGVSPQGVADEIQAAGAPGAIVNVDNRVAAASGYADLATQRRMRPNLNFRAGSLTKSFTATVVLQLAAEGRLSLEDTVEDRLPGLLPYGSLVTVRMLLSHTGGVPDYWESGDNALLYPFLEDPVLRARTWTPREIVDLIDDLPPDYPPGQGIFYSDTDYIILGMLIERVTGRSVRRETATRIVDRLDLSHTVLPRTRTSLPRPFTRGYTAPLDDEGNQIGPLQDMTEYNPSVLWAMGGLISNSYDTNRFYKALLGGRLLPAWLTSEMKRTIPFEAEGWISGLGFGLGIWSYDLPCGKRVFGHEGYVPGYHTLAFATRNGRKAITLEVPEILQPDQLYYDVIYPAYNRLWCHS